MLCPVLICARCSATDIDSQTILALRLNGLTAVGPSAWLTRIPVTAGGFIAPAGGRRLMAFATNRRRRLRDLPGVRIAQDGGDELIVTFDVTDLEAVAEVLGAKRRRRLTDEHRAKLTGGRL